MSNTLRAGTVVQLHGRSYRLVFPATVEALIEAGDEYVSAAVLLGRRGGRVRGEAKRRAVDYAALGRKGGLARGR